MTEATTNRAGVFRVRSRSLMNILPLPAVAAVLSALFALVEIGDDSIWVVVWVGVAAASAASATALFVGGYVLQALAAAEDVT